MSLRRFAALAAVGLALGACCATMSPRAPKGAAAQDVSALPRCRAGDKPLTLLNPSGLTGPASTSVTNWRVTKSWSIDHGAVRVDPAPTASRPSVSLLRAACNLLSASASSGAPVVLSSTSGSILEYGLLTVSPKIPRPSVYLPGTQITAVPQKFFRRPAWILVTVDFGVASASAGGTSVPASANPPRQAPQLPQWPDDVIALDAAHGDASIAYFQADRLNPTYTVIPYEVVSVPWRNPSVAADRESATIQIYAPACDVLYLNGTVLVHRLPQVQVDVGRALGHPCGPDTWNTVTIRPALPQTKVPSDLSHPPPGPIDGLYYWGPWAEQ